MSGFTMLAVRASSALTDRTVKPLAPSSVYIFWRCGISTWHGAHQVAQKLIRTTLPFMLESETDWLSRSRSVKSGATSPRAQAAGAQQRRPKRRYRAIENRRVIDSPERCGVGTEYARRVRGSQ